MGYDYEADEEVEKKTPTSIRLPLEEDGEYDFVVDWGDSQSDHITAFDQAEVTHEYGRAGEFTMQLNGTVDGFAFGEYRYGEEEKHPSRRQIRDISQWGCVGLGNSGYQFHWCRELKVSAVDVRQGGLGNA